VWIVTCAINKFQHVVKVLLFIRLLGNLVLELIFHVVCKNTEIGDIQVLSLVTSWNHGHSTCNHRRVYQQSLFGTHKSVQHNVIHEVSTTYDNTVLYKIKTVGGQLRRSECIITQCSRCISNAVFTAHQTEYSLSIYLCYVYYM